MFGQFNHKALTEAHHFCVALAFWIEITAALAAADRQRRQRVLEDLFKRQEFHHPQRHRRMKPQTAFIGTQNTVVLNTVTAVDMHLSLIVHPRHFKLDNPLRFCQAFQNRHFLIFRMMIKNQADRCQHFFHRLQKFGLRGVFLFQLM